MTRYLPFGGYRGSDPAFLTDRGFTGHKMNNRASNDLGLIFMGARFYVPSIGRFASADTLVPDPTNPQQYNRYSYVLNNPLRYSDPTGHCIFGIDTWVCLAIAGLVVAAISTGSAEVPQPPQLHYPVNSHGGVCGSSLPDCFGDIVYLKDFSGHGENNPIPFEEFTKFADKVVEDLYSHDLSWPGFSAGRATYDTPFYNGGQSPRREIDPNSPSELWPANQQVCIDTIGCYGRSEINYIAQGMWAAATGEPLPLSRAIVRTWKGWEYVEFPPSDGTFFWLQYGYDYYKQWLENHKE